MLSGEKILAITIPAGAFIIEAVNSMVANFILSSGSDPPNSATYAAKTPPAMVAIPPVIRHINSEVVIFLIYGLTSRGASV